VCVCVCVCVCACVRACRMSDVSGGKVNNLGGHSIGHSKQKKSVCTCVLFRTASERVISLYNILYTVRCTDEQHSIFPHELQSG
jgi:hypothetical protein